MTEDNKKADENSTESAQEAQLEAQKESERKAAKPNKNKKRGSPIKRAFWYLVLIIIIATIAWIVVEKPYQNISFDVFKQSTPDREQTTSTEQKFDAQSEIRQVENQVNNLRQQFASVEQQLQNAINNAQYDEQLEPQVNQLAQALRRQQQQLDELSRQLPQRQLQQMSEWRLFEAKQTVSAAARLLWGAKDYKAALGLLKIADTQLAGIESAAAIQIRQLLATDIARVEAALNSQSNQVALTIAGLQQRISDLPNRVREKALNPTEQGRAVTDDGSDWQTNLRNNWNAFLDTFIRIQPSQRDAEPLLTQVERQAMSLRLELLLTMAQHAALKDDGTLWRAYIDQAIPLIRQLKGQTMAANDVVERLQSLRRANDAQRTVRELESLDALARAVNQGGLK